MDAFQFIKCPPKAPIHLPGQIPLFFHPDFVHRNGNEGVTTYLLKRDDQVCALIHFELNGKQAVSLPQATYGGMAILSDINREVCEQFMLFIIDELTQEGISDIEIQSCPSYFSYEPITSSILRKLGFTTKLKDINQYMLIDNDSFTQKINRNRNRNLRQCKHKNYRFQELTIGSINEAYEVLTKNRASKDYSLSMSFDELHKSIKQFPKRYLVFSVMDADKIVASAVCVRVNKNILYDFYHGELPQYTKYSPVTFLVEGIYNYASSWGYKLLDLGTSSPAGKLNEGVYQFKKSLGAFDCNKITYTLAK